MLSALAVTTCCPETHLPAYPVGRAPRALDGSKSTKPRRAAVRVAATWVGFVGTISLGLISVAAGVADNGDISGGAAAVLLLAIGAFLLNAAHIVGLLFFQSVSYTGIWEKFMARLALVYTLAALVIALILWLA